MRELRFCGPGRRSLGAKVSKKSRKSLPGPPGPGVSKVRKKSRKRSEKSQTNPFSDFLETFRIFFETFFWLLGPRDREAPADFFETFWFLAPRLLLPGPRNRKWEKNKGVENSAERFRNPHPKNLVSPYPLNLRGGVSKSLVFTMFFFEGRPLNLGGWYPTLETRHFDTYPNRFWYVSGTYPCAPALCLEAVPDGYPPPRYPPYDFSRREKNKGLENSAEQFGNPHPKNSRGEKRAPFERALCSSWYLCVAWPFLGFVIAHFNSLSVEAMERRGGKERMEGRREVVKAKNLAENKVHVWKVHVCPLLKNLKFFETRAKTHKKTQENELSNDGSFFCPPLCGGAPR